MRSHLGQYTGLGRIFTGTISGAASPSDRTNTRISAASSAGMTSSLAAPGGGFVYNPNTSGRADDPLVIERRQVISDVYFNYARDYYKTH